MGGIFKTPQEEYEEGVEIGKQLDIVGQELHEIPFSNIGVSDAKKAGIDEGIRRKPNEK